MVAHPQMFDDDDPVLARLRGVALGFPDAVEVISHGRPFFRAGRTGKGFAVYGGFVRLEAGGHEQHPRSCLFATDPSERSALLSDQRFWSPAYYGPAGWLGIDLDLADATFDEVAELLDASFRQVARATLIKRLEQ